MKKVLIMGLVLTASLSALGVLPATEETPPSPQRVHVQFLEYPNTSPTGHRQNLSFRPIQPPEVTVRPKTISTPTSVVSQSRVAPILYEQYGSLGPVLYVAAQLICRYFR